MSLHQTLPPTTRRVTTTRVTTTRVPWPLHLASRVTVASLAVHALSRYLCPMTARLTPRQRPVPRRRLQQSLECLSAVICQGRSASVVVVVQSVTTHRPVCDGRR